jgi:signal peptidase I
VKRDPLARLFPNMPRPWRVALDWVITIAGAVAIVLALKAWVVNPYRIPSSSMEPTLHCAQPGLGCEASGGLFDGSDRVLANRLVYHFRSPHRGEIIVFKTPPAAKAACGEGGTFVKRLIGLPGDTVHEDSQGFLWINGKKLNEPYIKAARRAQDLDNRNKTWHVPKGQYFFVGDNRGQSCDSRRWGSVPRSDIIGKVFFIYWPPQRIGFP